MQMVYNGVDITPHVEIEVLSVSDNCGDQLDAIDALLSDSEEQWSGWNPQKGDTLEIVDGGYCSGSMWIDQIRQESGRLALGAVSLPPNGRDKRTKSWEQITLVTLAAEKAAQYGLTAKFYGVESYPYARLDQISRGDFGFLQERARLEGCTIKLFDGSLVAYGDRYIEQQSAVKTIDVSQFCGDPVFNDSAGKTFSGCAVSWQGIAGTYTDAECIGGQLSVSNIPVSSAGEAQRFAKNLLRSYNKRETLGEFPVTLDTTITGGSVIAITGMGRSDGNYLIELAKHDFTEQVTSLRVRRCFVRY